MKARSRFSKRYLAFLCVALILACTLSLFLPHNHTHLPGADCEACAMIDFWRSLLLVITLLVSISHYALCAEFALEEYAYIAFSEKATLVGQKVKLSN